jgi:hypothetical protein
MIDPDLAVPLHEQLAEQITNDAERASSQTTWRFER